jgi:hypothetical protein
MLRFVRNRKHEQAVRDHYASQGMPLDSVPTVHVGYDGETELLHAFISREEWPGPDVRWHVSIAAHGRVPSWNEIAETLHALRPGIPFVLGVPPRSWWMNVNPHVLHAWETKDVGLIAQWRFEARGDAPS